MDCGNEDSLQGLLIKMTHAYFGRAYLALKEMEIHPKQVPMMHLLSKREGLSQREISSALGITPPTVAVSIKRMEKAGVLERRPDDKDQRLTRIYLTSKGEQLSRNVHKMVAESETIVLRGFSESEICLMKRFFRQMIENLETNTTEE